METTASNPATGGLTTKTTTALRVAATAFVLTAGLALVGIAGVSTVAADEPAPAVEARIMLRD